MILGVNKFKKQIHEDSMCKPPVTITQGDFNSADSWGSGLEII